MIDLLNIQVNLDKDTYHPNENVLGTIEFRDPLMSDVKHLKLIAKGEEKITISEIQHVFVEGQDVNGDGVLDTPSQVTPVETVTFEANDEFFNKEIPLPSLTSPAKFEFTLPLYARSSYESENVSVKYQIQVMVDTDAWPDLTPSDHTKVREFKVLHPGHTPTPGAKV